ncbi:MAG TPA: succinate dehydrogenase, cytochrome b556 subunit, partial [Alphaproteobacteria bacterium]|nr:succinate dehydrogenase, cytochrome b556 subunit [Alphaproteobacteria bacterium]
MGRGQTPSGRLDRRDAGGNRFHHRHAGRHRGQRGDGMTGNPRFSPRLSPRLSLRFSPSYLAFVLHRLSGVLLALFLPFHFLVLGLAIEGEARLDSMLAWTEQPLVKFAEWGLVVVFSLHLILGLRVLLIEWAPWGHAAMPDQSMP